MKTTGQPQQPLVDDQPEEPTKTDSDKGDGGKRKATIAARMYDLIRKDPATHEWTSRQFAEKLECQPSTVVATAVWKELAIARESVRLTRGEQAYKKGLDMKVDKCRLPKRKKRPHSLDD